MNPKTPTQSQQEVDLYFIWKRLIGFIDSMGVLFVKSVRFLIKNIFIIVGIIIIGTGIGYYLDLKKGDVYKHEIFLVPNFGSSAYLYEKIKNIQPEEGSGVLSVNVEPVIDIFNFLSSKQENLKIADFMSQNNVNFSEHNPGNQTEKIYKYHILTLLTNKPDTDGSIVEGFLDELNQEKYFLERQTIEQGNTAREIKESLTSIQNINAVFKKLGNPSQAPEKGDVNIEMYPEVNGLLYSKENLITNLNRLEISQIEQSKIFYDVSKITNIKVNSVSKMITLPFVLVFLFIAIVIAIRMYKQYNSRIS